MAVVGRVEGRGKRAAWLLLLLSSCGFSFGSGMEWIGVLENREGIEIYKLQLTINGHRLNLVH